VRSTRIDHQTAIGTQLRCGSSPQLERRRDVEIAVETTRRLAEAKAVE
jgi:hypothetical protein